MIPLCFDYKREPKPEEDRNPLTGCGLDLGLPLYWAISQDGTPLPASRSPAPKPLFSLTSWAYPLEKNWDFFL